MTGRNSPEISREVAAAAGITVDALFRRSVRIFADRVAVTSDQPDEPSWTYAELGARADRLAAGLHAAGLRRGDRLAVLSETRPEYVELYVAAARLGIALVTLNIRLHPDELAAIIKRAGPVAVVSSGPLGPVALRVRELCVGVMHWWSLDPERGFGSFVDLHDTGAPVPVPVAEPGDLHNVLLAGKR